MPKALLLENIHPDAAQSLRDHGFEVECLRGALNEDELIDALEDVDLLGIRSKTSERSAAASRCSMRPTTHWAKRERSDHERRQDPGNAGHG